MSIFVAFADYPPPTRDDGNPWTSLDIEQAPDVNSAPGDFTVIDTITNSAWTPAGPDADPASPTPRSFDTDNATIEDGWFRVTWIDDDGGRSTASPPIHRGATSIATVVGQVRFEIGDRGGTMFTDAEIQLKLDAHTQSVLLAAADLCDILATRVAGDYDFKWKDGEFSRSQAAKTYAQRAETLRVRATSPPDAGSQKPLGYFPCELPIARTEW